ncbi:olfactory receptor 10A7-like [Monodelphis domestica]|uniref:olfactory receptor 10A7-like n=1 Tax=Monodelphis domestica TaxID=13616 RepID=UPI0024E1C209|nr:olfactory receptor 10A7-like [Monodelphis domestica]
MYIYMHYYYFFFAAGSHCTLELIISLLGGASSNMSGPWAQIHPTDPAESLIGSNQSSVVEFVLLGFSHVPRLKLVLFVLFLGMFLITILGNGLIVLLSLVDTALHTPMYFFLRNLALVEICFSLDIVPRMLESLVAGRGISLSGCALQLFLLLSCVTSECFLLTVMAYDRYVAICHPLHYGVLMSQQLCHLLAGACWVAGIPVSLLFTIWLFRFPFCGPRGVRHFLCDVAPLLRLVCADTSVFEAYIRVATVLVLMVPFSLITVSYGRVLAAVVRMPSATGRHKALSTCASHFLVVALFYGTACVIHLQPKSTYSPESKQVVSLSYTLVTPMLNPIIYSLRNKEVKAALWRILGRKKGSV